MKKDITTTDQRNVPLEDVRRQRLRSLVIAVGLAVLVVLFYLATIVRLGGNAFNRPI